MPERMSRLARNIEYWREQRGMSQAALSAKAGLASSAVNDILKTPDRSPRLTTVEALAKALGISIWQLIESGETPVEGDDPPELGITILEQEDLSGAEQALIEFANDRFGLPADGSALGIVNGVDLRPFGFCRGDYLLIVPNHQSTGELAAVKVNKPRQPPLVTVRYCAPPWLIRIGPSGKPAHEYVEAPGVKVLGACRKAWSGRLLFDLDPRGVRGDRLPDNVKPIR
jgi:transcriptional regulator with XRE-family HTH domain